MTDKRRFEQLETSCLRQRKRAHLRALEEEYFEDRLDETAAGGPSGIASLMADVSPEAGVIEVPPSSGERPSPLAEALRAATSDDERAG